MTAELQQSELWQQHTVNTDERIGGSWPLPCIRFVLMWHSYSPLPSFSHRIADLVERSIDRGEA